MHVIQIYVVAEWYLNYSYLQLN